MFVLLRLLLGAGEGDQAPRGEGVREGTYESIGGGGFW